MCALHRIILRLYCPLHALLVVCASALLVVCASALLVVCVSALLVVCASALLVVCASALQSSVCIYIAGCALLHTVVVCGSLHCYIR